MEINNNNNQIQKVIQEYVREIDAAKARRSSEPNEPEKTADTVEISADNRRDVENAREAIAKMPERRSAEVEEIKTRVKNGDYEPDARKVAERIVSHHIIDTLV